MIIMHQMKIAKDGLITIGYMKNAEYLEIQLIFWMNVVLRFFHIALNYVLIDLLRHYILSIIVHSQEKKKI